MTEAYPLAWPEGWPRTQPAKRQAGKFSRKEWVPSSGGGGGWYSPRAVTIDNGVRRVRDEVERMKGRYLVISTNVPTRGDGFPRSDRREPDDVGVAVYFQRDGKTVVFACDKWTRVADNLAAVAAHLDALRGIDRWGVGSLDRAFAGYEALPPPKDAPRPKRPWREVLAPLPEGLDAEDLLVIAERRYRDKAKAAHVDAGGSHDAMVELNDAITAARDELGQ